MRFLVQRFSNHAFPCKGLLPPLDGKRYVCPTEGDAVAGLPGADGDVSGYAGC